jgi:hypothetical protein
MLSGTFPAKNISSYGNGGSPTGSKFSVGSDTYQIQSAIVNCDYFINFAVCWAVGSNTAGVTLTLKNMMGAVSGNLSGGIHANFLSSTTPALAILNSQQMFKDKQVLAIIDAISIASHNGPFTPADGTAFSIIASKDMVAADYQGFLILKSKGLSSDRENVAKTIFTNAAKSTYGLGTNDPAAMDVQTISPPWTTSVIHRGEPSDRLGLKPVIERHNGRQKITFRLQNGPDAPVNISLFSADGARIWSGDKLEWSGQTLSGKAAAPGTYFYSIKAGSERLNGTVLWGK